MICFSAFDPDFQLLGYVKKYVLWIKKQLRDSGRVTLQHRSGETDTEVYKRGLCNLHTFRWIKNEFYINFFVVVLTMDMV